MSTSPNHPDRWLDAQLRSVPLPTELVDRLREVAREDAGDDRLSDAEVDRLLVDVAVPTDLMGRLHRIPRRDPRPALPRGSFVLVASVLVAMGVGFLALTGTLPFLGVEIHRELTGNESPTAPPRTMESTASNQHSRDNRGSGANQHSGEASESVVVIDKASATEKTLIPLTPDSGVANVSVDRMPTADGLTNGDTDDDQWIDLRSIATSGKDGGDVDSVPSPVESPRMPESVFGAPERGGNLLPQLELVRPILARGVKPPRVPGYDLAEQLRTGFHPFASPSAHHDLLVSSVPLTIDTQSYYSATRVISSGRLPAADRIRTEEFLAAMEYRFPPAPIGELALRTAAGPAPFASAGTRLLQLGVIAGEMPRSRRSPADITVVVDVPRSFAADGRLDKARKAMRDFLRELGPNDRVRIIAFDDVDSNVVEATGADPSTLTAAIDRFSGRRSTDFVAAVESACGDRALAEASPDQSHGHIVFLCEGVSRHSGENVNHVCDQLSLAHTIGYSVSIVDLSADTQQNSADAEVLESLSTAIGEPVGRGDDVSTMLLPLLRGLRDGDPSIAASISLKLYLNPHTVESYRLVGHEAATLTGPNAGAIEIDLLPGQVATVLYELTFKQTGGDDIATAEVNWRDPRRPQGSPQRLTQRISRVQFAKSFSESPLSLQTAALAARTAECLRQPSTLTAGRTLQSVLQMARTASPQVRDAASVKQLLELAERADRLAGQRPSSR